MSDQELIKPFIERAQAAQAKFNAYSQEQVDEVVAAVSWAGYSNAEKLAQLAFDHSGLGVYEDKVTKVKRKTMGTMLDLKKAKSVGVIDVDEATGVTTIAKPMGVIAAGANEFMTKPVAVAALTEAITTTIHPTDLGS